MEKLTYHIRNEIHNAKCLLTKTRAEAAFINSGGEGGGGQVNQVHQMQEVQSLVYLIPYCLQKNKKVTTILIFMSTKSNAN
ncbi:hypothetical protein ACFX2A_042936 [Malus domestica]